jgi:hypothetical protein
LRRSRYVPFAFLKFYSDKMDLHMLNLNFLAFTFLSGLAFLIVSSCATTVPYNRAKVERIQLLDSIPSRPYVLIKHIEGHAEGARTFGLFSEQPSFSQAELDLKEKAAEVDADAVINLKYSTGSSLWAFKNAWVEGDAIKWK